MENTPSKSARVNFIVRDCLNGNQDEAQIVEGIVSQFGFNPTKIAEHKEEIRALLNEMPETFHANSGGGWSFLNLCLDREGRQWGEHKSMEALVVLGIASGMASYCLPREMWSVLPGGMPYVAFDTSK